MTLQCWKCGASLAGLLLPLAHDEACPSCHSALHVCRMCRHFDAHRPGQCRELTAPRVADKTHANACGGFVPRPEAYKGGGAAIAQASRSALDAVFGAGSAPASTAVPGRLKK